MATLSDFDFETYSRGLYLNIPTGLRPGNQYWETRDALTAQWARSDLAVLPPGEHYIADAVAPPAGKGLLMMQGASLVIQTAANADVQNVILPGEGSWVRGGTVNGNFAARLAAGSINDAADDTWTWGVLIQNTSYVKVDDITSIGCECTTYTQSLSGGAGGNGGAVLINGERSSATSDVTGNVVRNITANNPNAGFVTRIRSTFTSYTESAAAPYVHGNEMVGIYSTGALKNAIEVVGPQTRFNKIRRARILDTYSFGGCEADFGAYGNDFEDVQIIFSEGFVFPQSVDGFSQRVSTDGIYVKSTRDNTFSRCGFMGGTLNGAQFVRGFRVVGPEVSTGEVVFDKPRVIGPTIGGSATADRVVGISLEMTDGALGFVNIIDPMIKVPGGRPTKGTGTYGAAGVKISGGLLEGDLEAYEMVGGAPVASLDISGVRFNTPEVAIRLTTETVTSVRGCTFLGTDAANRVIEMPALDNAVVRIGGNDFSQLATGSQNPFTGTPTGQTTGTTGCRVINEGGNVYRYRTPGTVSRGGHGATWFGDNDVLMDPAPAVGFTNASLSRVRSDSLPTVGTWAAGSIIEKITPALSAAPGWRCTASGTYGTLAAVTATTTSGSAVAAFSSATNLRVGQWVAVSGAGTRQIRSISGNNVTMTANYSASVATQAASYSAPSWEEMPYLGAKTYTLVVQPLGGTHTTADLEKTFSNAGATAISVFTLMTAAAGYRISYSVVDSDGIRVVPSSGDTIQDGTGTPSLVGALGKIESTAIGSTLTLESQDATQWFVSAKTGTWAVT